MEKGYISFILLVDDDKEIVEAIEIYLTQDGHQVLEAYDGIEAVEILKKESVDLLIMDIMMPRMDFLRNDEYFQEQRRKMSKIM